MNFFPSLLQFFLCSIILNEFYLSINGQTPCLITIQTSKGSQTSPVSQSGQVIDPLNIEQSTSGKKQCQINFLQLTFSTDEKFASFLEKPKSIDSLYDPKGAQTNQIRIDIQRFDWKNEEEFLSKDILDNLGGNKQIINTLIVNISQWIISQSKKPVFLSKTDLSQGPFKQIDLRFLCQSDPKVTYWNLLKDKMIQANSPCPTQIQFQSEDLNDNDEIVEQNDEDTNDEPQDDKTNVLDDQTDALDDQVEQPLNVKDQGRSWTFLIVIFVLLIIIGIVVALYYFVYLPRLKKKQRQGSFKADDDDAASTTSESIQSTNE